MKTQIQKYIPYIFAILAIIFAGFIYFSKNSDAVLNEEKIALEQKITENRKIREEAKSNFAKITAEYERQKSEWEKTDKKLAEEIENDKEKLTHIVKILGTSPSIEIIPQANAMNGNGTPVSAVPQHTGIQCAIGNGSHDVRHLAKNYPWVAGWKNNNPSGITLGSKALKKAFDYAGIKWFIGTARPKNEGSHYYGFPDLENGMRAKLLIIKRSYKNHTISSYLRIWWTDEIPTEIPKSRTIGSLSDSELISLIKPQIHKESGKDFTDFIFKNVLICN